MPTLTPTKKYHLCGTSPLTTPQRGADASIVISTAEPDRDGDVLVPEGAELDAYQRNPVVLYGHDHHGLPVGRAMALQVTPGSDIRASFVWLKDDPFADRVRNAFEQGILNAASIGFRPMTGEPNGRGTRYTRWELLEFSLVPVPANSHAVRALKQLGLDDPPELARASAGLDQLSNALKQGRVLSGRNENRLRQASTLIGDVLAQLDIAEEEEDTDDEGTTKVLLDGQVIAVRLDAVERVITDAVDDGIYQLTGRLPDPPFSNEPVLYMSTDELNQFIRPVAEKLVNRLVLGRLD